MSNTHIYQRSQINEVDGIDSLSKIAKSILKNSYVLDIGCNYGALGQYLIESKNCIVDGVDYNHEAIEIAKTYLNKAIVVDLENQDLTRVLNQKYDYIVCADVLEHLKDPGKTLKEVKGLLNENGKLLISIPNIAYIGVILTLMSGDFRYTHEGILDKTHLRFFTLNSFTKLLNDYGYKAKVDDNVIMPLEESEFATFIDTDLYNKLYSELKNIQNPLTYQYIIEAKLSDNEISNDLIEFLYNRPTILQKEFSASYKGKVFWRSNNEEFNESCSQLFSIPLGKDRHKICLKLPEKITAFRLNPCHKSGFIKLFSICLKDQQSNTIIWSWDGKAKNLHQYNHQSMFITNNENNGVILALLDNDAHINFDFTTEFKQKLTLEIELSWPNSPDYFFIEKDLKEFNNQLKITNQEIMHLNLEVTKKNELANSLTKTLEEKYHEVNNLTKTLETTYQEIKLKNINIEARYNEISQLHNDLALQNNKIESLQHECNLTTEKNNQQHWEIIDLKDSINQKSEHIKNLNHQIEQLQMQINNIVKSKSWIITKPLRYILRNFKKSNASIVTSNDIPVEDNNTNEISKQTLETSTNTANSYYETLFNDNNNPSQDYIEFKQYPELQTTIKAIAFYLPQFHPIPENDKWWGVGFTEWTNVSKAIPQFTGHYQPRLPGELGFYDLRLIDIMKRQIELAKNYGLFGFCFHYYWFGGKKLLEKPIEAFLNNKSLDFKFCLNWANENWSRRWDGKEDDILIGQSHSEEDDINFIKEMTKYFNDERYIRINDKPLLMVYRPSLFPNPQETATRWREYCRNQGIGEIYLVSTQSFDNINPLDISFDACTEFAPNNMKIDHYNLTSEVKLVSSNFQGSVYDYLAGLKHCVEYQNPEYTKFRGICPSWDNEARKPGKGTILHNANPQNYEIWLDNICDFTNKNLADPEKLIFINAWNEWAEGAILEPCRKYGYAYLDKTNNILQKYAVKK